MTAKRFSGWFWVAVAVFNTVVCISHFVKGPYTSESILWLLAGLFAMWSSYIFIREARK